MSALHGVMCPFFLFTGVKPMFEKVVFGHFVEVYGGTLNMSGESSLACIALYQVGNALGSWMFCLEHGDKEASEEIQQDQNGNHGTCGWSCQCHCYPRGSRCCMT